MSSDPYSPYEDEPMTDVTLLRAPMDFIDVQAMSWVQFANDALTNFVHIGFNDDDIGYGCGWAYSFFSIFFPFFRQLPA